MTDSGTLSEAVWLGIDLGTQSVRALVVSSSGKVLGNGSQKFTSRSDGPRHEQDPSQWWECTAAACRAAMQSIPADSLRGLAVDGTSGTILFMDSSGQPLTPGLMYDDTRAIHEARLATDSGATVWQSLGYNRMQPAWVLPKLLWLLRHEPYLAKSGKLAHQTDFINHRLIGSAGPSDSSNTLKTGYDLVHQCWPSEVMENLGVPEKILPPVVRSGAVIGTVCKAAAEMTGIPAGTPVVAGMTDGCAAQIRAGALSPGSWNSVLGTTLVLKGVTTQPLSDPNGVVYSHRSPDGNWLPGGASSVGAGILSAEFPNRDLDQLSALAAEHELANAITYPLAGRGERFPFDAPDACKFTLGKPRDDVDRFASLLQGIAFVERLCFDYLDWLGADVNGRLTLTGGGARSRYWCQLRADVLDRTVTLVENAEPAMGMAILAAAQGRSLAEVAGAMVTVRETIDPRPDRHRRFTEPYLRLIDELARHGWLPAVVTQHTIKRATR